MKILAIIPARKNSKRIKFKNKKKLLDTLLMLQKKLNFFATY
jgi:CMP-N-acetylneuraminic acid synthetase